MGTIKVDLPDPVETVGGMVTVAEFREPVARDFMALGEPIHFVRADGGVMVIEKEDVIAGYMERLLKPPLDPVALGGMSLANALKCRSAVLDFFDAARVRTLPTPPIS